MRFSVSTYSFSQLLKAGEMTYLDTIAKAKEMGFDGVELVDAANFAEGDVMEFGCRLAEEAKNRGIELSNFAFGADFINGEGGTDREIARVKKMIDLAEVLGVPSVRHDVLGSLGGYATFAEALPVLAAACREITAYAQEKGIRTMVENHGFVCQGSAPVLALYQAVAHENFALLCDVGNFLCVDQAPIEAVRQVLPHAGYVHAKDFLVFPADGAEPEGKFFRSTGGSYLRGTIIGRGNAGVEQAIGLLPKMGYDGWVTIEFEGAEPALEGIAEGFANTKRFLQLAE